MRKVRLMLLTGLAVGVIGAVWHAKTSAQGSAGSGGITRGVVTVFDHTKLDTLFNKALASGGTTNLWSKGNTNVDVHSRETEKAACKPEGCSHTGYTAVVYVASGAATLVIGGTAKAGAPDKFGGLAVQGGESHRISQGDVYIVPPDTLHWYKDVQAPFRYIEVPVP
jgi:hypothetical protein